MGRILEGGEVAKLTVDFGVSSGVFNLRTGTAVAQNDLLELGPNGFAYPVKVTDYAAVSNMVYGVAQTSDATGRIVTQTQVVAGQTVAYYRQALLQGPDGSIYTFTNNSGTTGLLLSKYSAGGGLVSQAAVDSAATAYANHQAFFLSNGSIAVLALATGTTTAYFAIYDTHLVQVKARAALSEVINGTYFSACALSGGGFAVVYQPQAAQLTSRLVTYDNTGTAVLAPTTIWTRTGTSGVQYHRMAQLSDGNLAIAVSSQNTVSSIGLYHGIVTTAGAPVLAFANLSADSVANIPEISVLTDYYGIARPDNTGNTMKAFVFSNAGVLQGAGFNGGTAGQIVTNTWKLINDGTAFYLIWPRSSDAKEVLTKLPVTGTGYVTTVITTTGTTNYNAYIDAFCESGLIACAFQAPSTGGQMRLFVVSTATMSLVATASTNFGGSSTNPGNYPRLIPGGDFSFICMYDFVAGETDFCVGKYANTSIMGVAQGAAAAGALAPVATPAGGYVCNELKGSPTKTFDHSTANIYGNKGSMLTYGVTLKGL